MSCDGPTRSIMELYTILRTSRSPQPDVQSPGVDITLAVDVACWWFALLCKPLAKPTALRTRDPRFIYNPLPHPTPSSKCPRKFLKSLCEIWRRQTVLGIYQHNVPAPPAYSYTKYRKLLLRSKSSKAASKICPCRGGKPEMVNINRCQMSSQWADIKNRNLPSTTEHERTFYS